MLATLALFLLGTPLRPVVAPQLPPEPAITPAQVPVVEIAAPDEQWDTDVLVRPYWTAPLAGQVRNGARVPVRGVVVSEDARGFSTLLWYALAPFVYVCSNQVFFFNDTATTE